MNSSCEALLKLKIMSNTGIRAPPLALFFKCFAWTLFSLYQLMIINGLPVAIPPPVEFHFSNPPADRTNRSTQPQQAAEGREKGKQGCLCPALLCLKPEQRSAGASGSSAPHLPTDPASSVTLECNVNISRQQSRYMGQHSAVWWRLFIPNISISPWAFRKAGNPLHRSISEHQAAGVGLCMSPVKMVSVLRMGNAHLVYLGIKRRNCYYLKPATIIWFIFKWKVHFVHRNSWSLLF